MSENKYPLPFEHQKHNDLVDIIREENQNVLKLIRDELIKKSFPDYNVGGDRVDLDDILEIFKKYIKE